MNGWLVAAVVVLALAVSGPGGAHAAPGALALAGRLARRRGRTSLAAQRAERVLAGGLVIGVLERVAVTGAILLGHPEGIAIVVAIKGLGRYPELRGPGTEQGVRTQEAAELGSAVSERFIIGTLASLIWAVGIGVGALAWIEAAAR